MAGLALPSPCCCSPLPTSIVIHGGARKELQSCCCCFKFVASNLILRARVSDSPAVAHRCRRWRMPANAALRAVVETDTGNSNVVRSQPAAIPSVEIPVTCYMILGVSNIAEKDEIVKAAMQLKNAHIEEGYTAEVVVNRQDLLMDARDKLLFEPEYGGDIKENIQPKSSYRIPWTWFPAALCLLQEAGEDKIVLDIGRKALQHPDGKAYIHDVLLSMALAECAIAKVCFEKDNISKGFEALARAQCLLRSKISLGQTTLLSQIEESLEEIAPACTLELLGLSQTPENAERRIGAISALRELLRQGLDVENSCKVQEWSCFLNQALSKLMAREIVELLPWGDLALKRKNKKSLESHNQRVVIDFNCFYMVLIAHIALGFANMQKDLIHKGQMISECLISSEGIDLKFEEAFCSFLLGQGDEATACEKLRQLEQNSKPTPRSSISPTDVNDVSNTSKSLESWLKDSVLSIFPDTRDCSSSLVKFFSGEKRISVGWQAKRSPQAISIISQKSIKPSLALDRKSFEDVTFMDSTRHLGPAVKQLTPSNLQIPLSEGMANGGASVNNHVQSKGKVGLHQNRFWEIGFDSNAISRMVYIASFGFVLWTCLRFLNLKTGGASRWRLSEQTTSNSTSWSSNLFHNRELRPESMKESNLSRKLKKFVSMLKIQNRHQPEVMSYENSRHAAISLESGVYKQLMPVEEAEFLVKKWQDIKAEALGPNHDVDRLFDILDESMLVQWQTLADTAKANSCFWKFVLLQLSVQRADILKDDGGKVLAEIEVIVEEAAELVDSSQPKNPNYYSTYTIHYCLKRQDDGSWRFCEGDVRAS